MLRTNWWRPLPVLALLLVATLLSASAGDPDELPGVAMGWSLLLHLERGALLVAGLAVMVLIGVRATMGEFPSRLGQIEYAVSQAAAELYRDAAAWEERLNKIEAAMAPTDKDPRQQI